MWKIAAFSLLLSLLLTATSQADELHSIPSVKEFKPTDQGDAGICWAHAFAAYIVLSEHLNTELAGVGLQLSPEYMDAVHIRKRAQLALYESKDLNISDRYFQGSYMRNTYGQVLLSGMVPIESWQPVKETGSSRVRGSLMKGLKNSIKEYRKQLEKITDKATGKIKDQDALTNLREIAKAQQDEILGAHFGPLPKEFSFRGAFFSPDTFRDTLISSKSLQFEALKNLGYPPNKKENPVVGEHERKYFPSPEELSREIKNEVDAGRPLMTEICVIKKSWNLSTGYVGNALVGTSFDKCPEYGHAVVITGYYYDKKKNRVTGYRVLNSWGENSGDHGYFNVSRIYADTFIMSVNSLRRVTNSPNE